MVDFCHSIAFVYRALFGSESLAPYIRTINMFQCTVDGCRPLSHLSQQIFLLIYAARGLSKMVWLQIWRRSVFIPVLCLKYTSSEIERNVRCNHLESGLTPVVCVTVINELIV